MLDLAYTVGEFLPTPDHNANARLNTSQFWRSKVCRVVAKSQCIQKNLANNENLWTLQPGMLTCEFFTSTDIYIYVYPWYE